jgi:hypothetical protein
VTRTRAQLVTIAGLLCSLTCVAILHVVRTDLPPASHRLSEYANGPYGWLMTAAFVALACGLMSLGIILRAEGGRGRSSWIIPSIAFLGGVGAILSAAFPTGVSPTSETIHSRASALATVAVVALALVYSIPAARRGANPDRVGTRLAFAAAALTAISPVVHDTRWTGLGQRLLWTAVLAWLLWVAWRPPSVEQPTLARHGSLGPGVER